MLYWLYDLKGSLSPLVTNIQEAVKCARSAMLTVCLIQLKDDTGCTGLMLAAGSKARAHPGYLVSHSRVCGAEEMSNSSAAGAMLRESALPLAMELWPSDPPAWHIELTGESTARIVQASVDVDSGQCVHFPAHEVRRLTRAFNRRAGVARVSGAVFHVLTHFFSSINWKELPRHALESLQHKRQLRLMTPEQQRSLALAVAPSIVTILDALPPSVCEALDCNTVLSERSSIQSSTSTSRSSVSAISTCDTADEGEQDIEETEGALVWQD